MTPDKDFFLKMPNRLVDFGPPLPYDDICKAYTVPRLSYWEHADERTYEIIVLQTKSLPRSRVEGILYSVTDEELKFLDKRRQNGVEFDRKLLPVTVPFSDNYGDMIQVNAWIYLAKKEIWTGRIEYGTSKIPREKTFFQPAPIPDATSYLHNRRAFFRPKYPSRVGNPPKAVVDKVRSLNELTVKQLEKPPTWYQKFMRNDE